MANRTVSVNLVANVGSYVSSMNAAAGATLRLGESATSSTKKAQGGFGLASKGALVMGAAVVGGLGMAISKSMDFEKSMSAVGAATQATGSTLLGLRDAAMKAGADTAFSATEAADAITEMGKAGVSAKDIMGGGLTGALSLAAAGQIDVADAAGIASTAMAQFNLTGKDLPHVADLLAAGAGKAMGSVGDLGAALNQAGLMASASGLSIEETTGTLAAFAHAGLIGSDSGTSFKTMLSALQAPSAKAAGIMADLGINMYDAQGNMLGAAQMAGQLQTHLGALTEEQRNSALATIFGTDAVRAANVLYKEGASGIQGWIDKTNEAGYAAKQAAALQDNLAGDLEKLGGAFDTLMIQMGSGGQGPLRFLVQTFTDLIDVTGTVFGAISDLPGPVLAAAAAIGILYLANGPLAGTFASIGAAVSGFATKAAGAVTSVSGFRGALSGIASSISPASLAITGITMLVPSLISGFQSMTGASNQAKSAQEGFAEALRATNGVMDENSRKAAQDALVNADLVDVFSNAGVSAKDAIDGLLGNAGAQDRVNAALQTYISTSIATEGRQNKNAEAARISRNDYEELAKTLGMTAEEAKFFAGAVDASTGATTAAAAPTTDFATKMEDVATAADDAKKATNQFKLSLDILTGANISMIQVESAFEAAVASADGALKNMHGTVLNATGGLNMQSESGRAAADVLLDVRDSGNQLISTMIQQGATSAQVAARDAQLRASFIATAGKMGITGAAANSLADQILGIPASRKTTITADTGPATRAVDALVSKISKAGGYTVAVGVGGVQGGQNGHADGGYTGPGGKYQPAGIVHAGEIVWSQADIAAHGGVGTVESMRTSRPGYADGGLVLGGQYKIPVGLTSATLGALEKRLTPPVGTFSGMAGSGVQRWLPLVLRALSMVGQPASLAQTVLRRMNQESGGNPNAINLWDSNAKAGHPSQGLMQTIPGTFSAYHFPGTSWNITDPLANILASMRYAMSRYGSLSAAYNKAGGYANGGKTPAGSPFWVGENGPELMWSNREQYVTSAAKSREFSGGGRGGTVAIDSATITALAKAVSARSTQITAFAAPNERALASAIVERQRDLEFLHG